MIISLNQSSIVLTLQMLAFWPVGNWYITRTIDGSDEPWGVIALGTAILFLAVRGRAGPLSQLQVASASFFTLLYIPCVLFAPPIVRAIAAVLAIGSVVSAHVQRRSLHFGIIALLLLSLPLIASLQFYLGYPIRLITTHLAAALIGLSGFPVTPQGTSLNWLGEIIAVDAPCSGIRMLWTGLYLNFTLASFSNIGALATWVTYSLAMATVFIGNLLRTYLLFFVESHIVVLPAWGHSLIGVVAFTLVALAVLHWNRVVAKHCRS